MRNLRNCCAVKRRAIAGAGLLHCSADITRRADMPAVTRPQCVNMLREALREIMPGAQLRAHGMRDGRARNTARKLVDSHLTRPFHGVVLQIGY